MSEPDGRGRGHEAAPPTGYRPDSTAVPTWDAGRPALVAPLEWVSFGASVAVFLCLFMPWFAVSCPPGAASAGCAGPAGGLAALSLRGLDLAPAVVGCTLLLIGGTLPVLRHVERALARSGDPASGLAGPRAFPRPTVLAPVCAAVGMLLVFLQLVHGDAPVPGGDVSGEVQRTYGVTLAFITALVAGASAVLGHIQGHGHRLLPARDTGAPDRRQ